MLKNSSFDWYRKTGRVRAHHGLAWFPLVNADGQIGWKSNPNYLTSTLRCRTARAYSELGLSTGTPIYEHLRRDPNSIQWVSEPAKLRDLWPQFEP
jgi:glucose-6-phosphate isomerase, archaeal